MILRACFSGMWIAMAGVLAQGDPFAVSDEVRSGKGPVLANGVNVDLTVEVFAVPLGEVALLGRLGLSDQALYQSLVSRLGEKGVEQVLFQSAMSRSGEVTMIRDGGEMIYPTESEPAGGVPGPPNLKAYEELYTPGHPVCFESRNLGWSCFLTPFFDLKSGWIEVEAEVKRVELVRYDHWGRSPCLSVMPRFSEDLIQTSSVVFSKEERLLGTMGECTNDEGERLVRLAFLRAEVFGDTVKRPVKGKKEFRLRYEVFALPIAKAAEIRRSLPKQGGRYGAVLRGLQSKEVRQEALVFGAIPEEAQALVQQVEDIIHPTDYDPPGFGGEVMRQVWDASPRGRRFSYNPLAFDTQSVGTKLGYELRFEGDDAIQFRIQATDTKFLKRNAFGEGISRMEMPEFGFQEISTWLDLVPGEPSFAGTLNQEDQPEMVRWSFVTVSRIE